MSISEQVKELRIAEETFRQIGKKGIARFLQEAADTIESLSAKLQAVNMERSDMISRNKLIEEIDKEIDGVIVKDTYSKGKKAGLRKAKILAEEQTVTHYSGGWIACEDRLPPQPKENPVFEGKPLELYLVSVKNTNYAFRAFWNGKFFTDGFSKLQNVEAWQLLPEPYRP